MKTSYTIFHSMSIGKIVYLSGSNKNPRKLRIASGVHAVLIFQNLCGGHLKICYGMKEVLCILLASRFIHKIKSVAAHPCRHDHKPYGLVGCCAVTGAHLIYQAGFLTYRSSLASPSHTLGLCNGIRNSLPAYSDQFA